MAAPIIRRRGCSPRLGENSSTRFAGIDNFRTMVEVAVEHQKPVRIGVNWGSLD
jgi:4-hydroxy-3-methylbut-2-en-1-yl diphosphate synthase IspG/GcpE